MAPRPSPVDRAEHTGGATSSDLPSRSSAARANRLPRESADDVDDGFADGLGRPRPAPERWTDRWRDGARRRRSLVAGGATVVAAATLAGSLAALAAGLLPDGSQDAPGRSRTVVVATRDLETGAVVEAGSVEARAVPESALPARGTIDGSALGTVEGQVVRDPIVAGEAVVDERLAGGGRRGAEALLRTDERALTVPAGPSAGAVAVGDVVDLLAVDGSSRFAGSIGPDEPGRAPDTASSPSAVVVASRARVVGTADDDNVIVAVSIDDVGRTAAAIVAGTVLLALRSA